MATYTKGLTPLLDDLQSHSSITECVVFTYDLKRSGIKSKVNKIVVGTSTSQKIKIWLFCKIIYIIVKHQYEQNAKEYFPGPTSTSQEVELLEV